MGFEVSQLTSNSGINKLNTTTGSTNEIINDNEELIMNFETQQQEICDDNEALEAIENAQNVNSNQKNCQTQDVLSKLTELLNAIQGMISNITGATAKNNSEINTENTEIEQDSTEEAKNNQTWTIQDMPDEGEFKVDENNFDALTEHFSLNKEQLNNFMEKGYSINVKRYHQGASGTGPVNTVFDIKDENGNIQYRISYNSANGTSKRSILQWKYNHDGSYGQERKEQSMDEITGEWDTTKHERTLVDYKVNGQPKERISLMDNWRRIS